MSPHQGHRFNLARSCRVIVKKKNPVSCISDIIHCFERWTRYAFSDGLFSPLQENLWEEEKALIKTAGQICAGSKSFSEEQKPKTEAKWPRMKPTRPLTASSRRRQRSCSQTQAAWRGKKKRLQGRLRWWTTVDGNMAAGFRLHVFCRCGFCY